MKSIVIILTLSVLLFAHPPQKVSIEAVSDTITVTIAHPTEDTASHYIQKVELQVKQASKGITGRTFHLSPLTLDKQDDSTSQTARFILTSPLVKGDVIFAKAICTSGNSKTQKRVYGVDLYFHEQFEE